MQKHVVSLNFSGRPVPDTKVARRYRQLIQAHTYLLEAQSEASFLIAIFNQDERALEKKAVWCSAFMNYSRCFTTGDTNFYNEIATNFSAEEKQVHEWIIKTRNTLFGHSDGNQYLSAMLISRTSDSGKLEIDVMVMRQEVPSIEEIHNFKKVISKSIENLNLAKTKSYEKLRNELMRPNKSQSLDC